jgi:hypothetical protein
LLLKLQGRVNKNQYLHNLTPRPIYKNIGFAESHHKGFPIVHQLLLNSKGIFLPVSLYSMDQLTVNGNIFTFIDKKPAYGRFFVKI